MHDISRLLVDAEIDRRTFIRKLVQAGVTAAAASSIASSLGAAEDKPVRADSSPQQGRIVENMTGGDVMLEFLLDWDVPYLFGLAGSEEVGLLDALVERPVPFVTCLHENAAMAMADGYSRSTEQTSIVSLHSIAGSAYALGQIVGSFRDRVPVVVCAGRQTTDYRGQDGFLEAENLHTLPQNYTQWTWDVMSGETIAETLRRAFMYAEAPPGGPTFVTFSHDLWANNVRRAEIIPRSRSNVDQFIPPPESHVKKIVNNLLQAQLPVLFLGNECIRHNPSDTVGEIAQTLGALVMTAGKIPVVFPTTHPNFAGEFPRDDPTLSAKIDCFWSLGAHMFKQAMKPVQPLISRQAHIMHTSLASIDIGRNYPVDTAAFANIETTADAVLTELLKRNLDSSAIRERKRWVLDYDAKRRKVLTDNGKAEWNSNPISVSRVMTELDRVMDKGAYVVSEIVTSDDHIRKYISIDHETPMTERRRNFDTTSGILGWGLAAAIGTKIGNPKKEVWCLTGDGCFNFGSQALWSAARYEVPLAIVIFNNGQYQANRVTQIRGGGKRIQKSGRYIGVNLGHPDINYVSMSAAYGIEGERVSDPNKLAAALQRCQRALQEGRPYVVDAKIARRFAGKDSDYYDFFSVAKMQNA